MESKQSRRTRMLMNVKFFSPLIDLPIMRFTSKMMTADMATQTFMVLDMVSTFTFCRSRPSTPSVRFISRPSMVNIRSGTERGGGGGELFILRAKNNPVFLSKYGL